MVTTLLSVGVGILLFLCFVVAYREGLRIGMGASKGIAPKPIKDPVTAVKDAVKRVEANKEAEKQADIYAAFEAFDGYTPEEKELMKRNGG